jgi:4-amino-4-deoxy-L-arabinose transferase-like glycosyltransferase
MNYTLLRRLAWAAGGLALLLALVTLTRSPLVWRDEAPFAAIAYSLSQGGSGTPTLLAEDPRFPITTFFYGPTFFYLGALLFKAFGLSVFAFRLLSLGGGVLLALAAVSLVRVTGGSWNWAAACWALVLLSPELGSTLTSGRMDTLAVAGELGGLALLLKGLRAEKGGLSWAFTVLAGLVWAATVLTTPRTLQFFVCLALAAPLWVRGGAWRRFAPRLALAGALTAAALCVWLWSQGETPQSWLAYLGYIARYNKHNNVLGGFWQLRPTPLWALTPPLCVVLLAFWRFRGGRFGAERNPGLAWAALALFGQGALTFITTIRPESYPLYWGLPLLAATLAVMAAGRQEVKRPLALALALAACLFGGLRVVKLFEVAASWQARNPQLLEDFARQHIPPGSRVAGPIDLYFYAVERAGSTYRFHEPLNDAWFPFIESKLNPAYPLAAQQRFPQHFLWWPEGGKPLPRSCRCAEADRVATYTPPVTGRWLPSLFRFGGGYPKAGLYRIPPP